LTSKGITVIIHPALSRQSDAGAICCIHIPNFPTPLREGVKNLRVRRVCGEVKLGEKNK